MKLEVLHVPDCPNLAPLMERLARVTDLPVATREIASDADATRYGMSGSPTLLVNGRDPFGEAGNCGGNLSCRLYRDESGRITPVPSAGQLGAALKDPAAPDAVIGRLLPSGGVACGSSYRMGFCRRPASL